MSSPADEAELARWFASNGLDLAAAGQAASQDPSFVRAQALVEHGLYREANWEYEIFLTTYVDNEYLRQGFRAGLLGVTFLLLMQATVAVTGWRSRASPDAVRRSLGATSLALALFFLLCGLVGEYLFFAGVSQEFAMIIALTGAFVRVARPARQVVPRRWESVPLPATGSGFRIFG